MLQRVVILVAFQRDKLMYVSKEGSLVASIVSQNQGFVKAMHDEPGCSIPHIAA